MHKFLKLVGQSTAAMALLSGCDITPPVTEQPIMSSPIGTEGETVPQPMAGLDAKIGQMLLVGFRGLQVNSRNDPVVQDIQDRHIGGVLLFDYDIAQQRRVRNIKSPRQVKALVQALQSYADIPLLVGIDYEGGVINRLPTRFGFPKTVSHQFLGNRNDLALTRQYATKMAQTLAQLGINLNFAPVVDVNTNPRNPIIAGKKRSFSAEPNIVTKHALEFIRAHRRQNVLCTLKHFPGHGSSTADSHLGVADVTNTWAPIELEPYAQIIQAGEADAIMTAHVFNQALDPNDPATLSRRTITGLLRGELGFGGVVFSDDIQMKAIANHYGLKTAVQKTIEAGVDIIVIGNNTGKFVPDIAERVAAIIKNLVLKGVIHPSRIDESYQRILRLKQRVGLKLSTTD